MRIFYLFFALLISLNLSAQKNLKRLFSPAKNVMIEFSMNSKGTPQYRVAFAGTFAIEKSDLGLQSREADFSTGLRYVGIERAERNDSWKPVWGEVAEIREHYREMLIKLENKDGQKMNIRFKAFNDGIGLRYEFPNQKGLNKLTVTDEMTEFSMTGDHTCWWIPGDYDSNEHVYSTTKISEITTGPYTQEQNILTQYIIDSFNVQTPLTMKADNGFHYSICEAGLVDFGAMHLECDPGSLRFKSFLIPSPDSTIKSINILPFNTPWRAVILAENAGQLIESKLVLNLNEPCKLENTDWIHPVKYVGIWWEMHVGAGSWDYSGTQDAQDGNEEIKPHGRHSATTANTKKYIDFASKYGFDGVLVEGWNIGWENWFNKMKDEVFSFTTPYPDYDIIELSRYAKEKGVRIIMHHETSSAVESYERQMPDAYKYMNNFGMNAVKTGYVGKIIPRGEWHDGQWMANHYVRVAEATADHKIMVNMHEAVRPSGLHRTYPNWLACESSRGNEFNAWSAGNPPEHETILPFTRILGGPMDYTPGIFETRMNTYNPEKTEVVHTTVAKQLALYVTLYSPLQMAADLPENYEKRLDVFQFIRDVPVDWSDTKVLHAAVGDHLTIARKDKNSENWFVGSITDESERKIEISLDFLTSGASYEATIYMDGKDAHWERNPYPVDIVKKPVKKGDQLTLPLAAGGGAAISIMRK